MTVRCFATLDASTNTNITARLSKLTDAYLDGSVDKEIFEEKKHALLMERRGLEEGREQLETSESSNLIFKYLELLTNLQESYENGNSSETSPGQNSHLELFRSGKRHRG